MAIEKKIYSSWAFKENESEKAHCNREIYKRHKEMLEHRIRPTVKPDLDNVAKLIYDALNGVAWHDDNAIVDTQVRKFYSDNPRVDVTIRTAGQENI